MKLKNLIIALCLALSLWPAATFAAFDPNSPATGHNIHSDVTAIRTNFNALRSCEASATEPSNLVAGMWWFDTTANVLKLRNEANTAWQSVWDFGNNRLPLNVLAPGELTADAGGRAKMADLYIVDAKVNDIAFGKITSVSIATSHIQASAVTPPKMASGMSIIMEPAEGTEYSTDQVIYITKVTYRIYVPTGTVNMRFSARLKRTNPYTCYAQISVGGVTKEITTTSNLYVWVDSTSFDVSSVAGGYQTVTISLKSEFNGYLMYMQGYSVMFF